eukprot:3293616-Amphidinium_carterae.1
MSKFIEPSNGDKAASNSVRHWRAATLRCSSATASAGNDPKALQKPYKPDTRAPRLSMYYHRNKTQVGKYLGTATEKYSGQIKGFFVISYNTGRNGQINTVINIGWMVREETEADFSYVKPNSGCVCLNLLVHTIVHTWVVLMHLSKQKGLEHENSLIVSRVSQA